MEFTILKAEYDELVENNLKFEMLLETIYLTKDLDWNKERLMINNEKVCDLLNLIDSFDYNSKLKALKEEGEKNNE